MKTKILVGFLGLTLVLWGKGLFACPAGQTCPAGKDCVADPNQCVADTSSSDSGGSSTAPTTTKDQLGLTLCPEILCSDISLQFGDGHSTMDGIGFEVDTSVTYDLNRQVSVGVDIGTVFSSDVLIAPVPYEMR